MPHPVASPSSESRLPAQPFRRFPVPADRQRRLRSDAEACYHCPGGTCCATEDPILLTAFDVLRLSAHLDLSPGEFLKDFTQDRFPEDGDTDRRAWLEAPDSSAVTWLRRRANSRHSPCLFLRYVTDATGLPRRVCSVHPARPLACREYYHDTCRTRWTGELAVIQAHAMDLVRAGRITAAEAEAGLAAARTAALAEPESAPRQLAWTFWLELVRMLHAAECNEEGSRTEGLEAWQDPLPEKLDRLLSRRNLRLEEKYGPEPWGEQLHPYADGALFHRSPERERLLRIARTAPRTRYFQEGGDYPLYVAHRQWLPAFEPARTFPVISPAALTRRLAALTDGAESAGGPTELIRALLLAGNFLSRQAGYVATLGKVLELAPAGTLEGWLLLAARRLDALGVTRPEAAHPAMPAVRTWAEQQPGVRRSALLGRRALRRQPAASDRRIAQWLATQQPDGGWGTHPEVGTMPATQGDYLQSITWSAVAAVHALADRLEHRR